MVIKPLFQKNYKSLSPYEYNARQRKELVIDTPFLFKYVQWIGNCFLSCRWILVRRFIFKGFFALLRYVVGRKPFTHSLRWSWELYRSCNLSFKVHNQGVAKNHSLLCLDIKKLLPSFESYNLDRTNKFCPCPSLTLRDRGVEKLRWISKANRLEGRAKILSTAEREALDLAKGWSFFPNIGHTVVTSFVLKKETTFKMKWLNWGIPWLFRVFLMRSTLCY